MKLKNQLWLTVIALMMSCSVFRDHPRQVPPNQEGHYQLTLKIITDDALMNNVRNVCMGISSYDQWNLHSETGNYAIVHLQYRNIPSGSLNRLLENLQGIRGLRVLEAKPIHY